MKRFAGGRLGLQQLVSKRGAFAVWEAAEPVVDGLRA
jgi:hypothetical protein